jgi:DNA-binding protein H-NS
LLSWNLNGSKEELQLWRSVRLRELKCWTQNDSYDHEIPMRKTGLDAMQFDELWCLHEEIVTILEERILAEKRELENRLAQLSRGERSAEKRKSGLTVGAGRAPRRQYPRVLPKYRNPSSPSETWSGRGKTPRWLVLALKTGRKIDDFKIVHAGTKPE